MEENTKFMTKSHITEIMQKINYRDYIKVKVNLIEN